MFDPEAIGPLDLSPLELSEMEHDRIRLRFKQRIRLQPSLNRGNHQFLSRGTDLGLDAFSSRDTRPVICMTDLRQDSNLTIREVDFDQFTIDRITNRKRGELSKRSASAPVAH